MSRSQSDGRVRRDLALPFMHMADHGVEGDEDDDQNGNEEVGHSLVAQGIAGALVPGAVVPQEKGKGEP